MSDDRDEAGRFVTADGGWCAPSEDVMSVAWPGEVETADLDTSPLDEEQDARASALHYARDVLECRGIGGGSTPPARMDLLSVAQWILTGSAHVV